MVLVGDAFESEHTVEQKVQRGSLAKVLIELPDYVVEGMYSADTQLLVKFLNEVKFWRLVCW